MFLSDLVAGREKATDSEPNGRRFLAAARESDSLASSLVGRAYSVLENKVAV
ncbi:hypothetical protein A2U01_0001402 [Trifolium medium]|uniref:Uncharacterized protein n=1 Tax=Trifolium medium TaxID=97028 RepID=A0A392M013_9FABA|nr:hypothetical protein [Trifolium medium]